jgi:hypothetical protein
MYKSFQTGLGIFCHLIFGFRHYVQMSWPFILTVLAYFPSIRKTSMYLYVLPFDQLAQGFDEYNGIGGHLNPILHNFL